MVPKKKNLWLFGSWGGKRFSSNTKVLYLYVLKHCPYVTAVWLTKNKNVHNYLKSKSLPVYYPFSIKGIIYSLRAQVIFISNEIYDVNPGFANSSIMVQLFHHVLPIKYMMKGAGKISNTDLKELSLIKQVRILCKYPHSLNKPDYYVTSSEWMANEVTHKKLWADKDKILVTGFPRSDDILKDNDSEEEMNYLKSIIPDYCNNDSSKIISFLPTHRDHDPHFDLFSFQFDGENFNNFLKEINFVLIIRFHPRDIARIKASKEIEFSNIVIEPLGYSDPYLLLRNSEILITDYGSIFSDYLLLNRPILFAKFDHENYVNERGLNWEYDTYTPGVKVNNWNDIKIALNEIIVNQNDVFSNDRRMLKEKIYKYTDNNNCKRVISEINKIIN